MLAGYGVDILMRKVQIDLRARANKSWATRIRKYALIDNLSAFRLQTVETSLHFSNLLG